MGRYQDQLGSSQGYQLPTKTHSGQISWYQPRTGTHSHYSHRGCASRKAEQSTAPLASSSRKRELEPETTARLAGPAAVQLSILDDKVLKAEKDIKRALAALDSAEKEEDEEERRPSRLLAQVEGHDGGPG